MNTATGLVVASYGHVNAPAMTEEQIRSLVPAAYATSAHACVSSKYTFIPTERVLTGLMRAGFDVVAARQTRVKVESVAYARHMIRLRRRLETVRLKDTIPEVVFINSHDGSSSYELRVGLFRLVCLNGLIVSVGPAFPATRVTHRVDVIDDVIFGAIAIAERFEALAEQVERMERRVLQREEQISFAEGALRLRYPQIEEAGMQPSQLLTCRRPEDDGDDLWRTLNRIQENLLRGGLCRRSASGRLTRTRKITSIREDVCLNGRLWEIASGYLTA